MISFDFEYYRPNSIDEAVNIFNTLDSQDKMPIYYAGGTEFISMARENKIIIGAVIDIKEIPECNVLESNNNEIVLGSAVTLSKISDSKLFPMLSKVIRRTADHTSRDKITLGGNICGKIQYREAVLPFLLCDSKVLMAGPGGMRTAFINDIFDQEIKLGKGEFLVQVITDKEYEEAPYEAVRRTKQEKVDYPLVSLLLMKKDNNIRAAFSGVCGFPFRSLEIEDQINKSSGDMEENMNNIVSGLPKPIISDIRGSAEYREFILRFALTEALQKIGGVE
jgi:xanthine dehydrogenase molybdenum-binding subunit